MSVFCAFSFVFDRVSFFLCQNYYIDSRAHIRSISASLHAISKQRNKESRQANKTSTIICLSAKHTRTHTHYTHTRATTHTHTHKHTVHTHTHTHTHTNSLSSLLFSSLSADSLTFVHELGLNYLHWNEIGSFTREIATGRLQNITTCIEVTRILRVTFHVRSCRQQLCRVIVCVCCAYVFVRVSE